MSISLSPSEISYQEAHASDNKQPHLIAASATSFTFALAAVPLRFWARSLSRAPIGVDDYTILTALFLTCVYLAVYWLAIYYGLGRHQIFSRNQGTSAKVFMAASALYVPTISTTKISILLFYRRLFPHQRFRQLVWFLVVFTAAYMVAMSVATLLECTPIEYAWDPTLDGHCVDINRMTVIGGSINVATDFVVLLMPMPLVLGLRISLRRRLQVVAIFFLGGLTCVFSVIRLTTVNSVSMTDANWSDAETAMWSVTEASLAIVNACLPTLRPVLNHLIARKPAVHNNRAVSQMRDWGRPDRKDEEALAITVQRDFDVYEMNSVPARNYTPDF